MKRVGVYLREGKWHLSSMSKTTAGVWIGGNIETLPASASAAERGEALRRALAASRHDVPHPRDFQAVLQPLLDAAGRRTWRVLARSAQYCSVKATDTAISILPNRWDLKDASYSPIRERTIDLAADASSEDLGAALERAFKACE